MLSFTLVSKMNHTRDSWSSYFSKGVIFELFLQIIKEDAAQNQEK